MAKTITKTFVNYSSESERELIELSNLHIKTANGKLTEKKVIISIAKATAIEVRVYDLSNFSKNTYHDFNRKVKKLIG